MSMYCCVQVAVFEDKFEQLLAAHAVGRTPPAALQQEQIASIDVQSRVVKVVGESVQKWPSSSLPRTAPNSRDRRHTRTKSNIDYAVEPAVLSLTVSVSILVCEYTCTFYMCLSLSLVLIQPCSCSGWTLMRSEGKSEG